VDQPRIVIVEDERIVAEDLKKTLEKRGYRIAAIASS
jgi:CheY-like chemotaxis protein